MLLIDKPAGITSYQVVDKIKKVTHEKKVGHTGTLDPMATGLMIILIGRNETKLQSNYLKLDKVYRTKILIGQKYDTLDITGCLLEEKDMSFISVKDISDIIKDIHGELYIPVPKFSAIKVDGKRLYKLARKKIDFSPPRKKMKILDNTIIDIHEIVINNKTMYEVEVNLHVSSGTYIRSIAEEVGKRLDAPTSLSYLRRTKVGNFDIKNAVTLEEYIKNNSI